MTATALQATPKTVVILGFEACLPSGLVGLVDMFWLANKANEADQNAASAPLFKVITASLNGKALTDGMGRRIAVDAHVLGIQTADAVLIPGLIHGANGLPAPEAIAPVAEWLRKRHAHGSLLAASCAGVFVLGEAGLLNQRRCTTTWWLHDELTRRYPKADALWGSALIEDRGVVSVGGPMSWVDMALSVIRSLGGPVAAKRTADFAVLDNTSNQQTLYAPKRYLQGVDPLLTQAEQTIRLASVACTATHLAAQLALSERTLHRRLKALTGEAPKAFITRTRLEMAKTLLDAPGASIKRVALQCGYKDEGSFRRVFSRFTGMSPSTYRQWAKSRGQ